MLRTFLLLVLSAFHCALYAEEPMDAARRHFLEIRNALSPVLEEDMRLSPPSRVTQTPGQPFQSRLPAVWTAPIKRGDQDRGYLMWEDSQPATLLEFAFDGRFIPVDGKGSVVDGTPALQQFPIPGRRSKFVASGCVPTSGASLVGYWARHGFPQWTATSATNEVDALQTRAKRLRELMHMQEFPDTVGYTNDGMALSGAFPQELARALEKDASEHHIQLSMEFLPFAFEKLKTEVSASRPVLLSCTVRLPHKPHLSWGHEVLGVGWLVLGDNQFVGIKDNFYPATSDETIRWIRKESFESLIAVQPKP